MVTTYQPFLFVTTDADLARKFSNIENQDKSFSQILREINKLNLPKAAILLSPTVNNQYFESFDYNIGYDSAETFSININFVAVDPFFEDYFVKFIFSEEKYRKLIEKEYIEKKIKPLQQVIDQSQTFSKNGYRVSELDIGNTVFDRSISRVEGIDLVREKDLLEVLDVNQNLKTIDQLIGNKVDNLTYFVFGINDRASTPVVAQFRSCEVSQQADGIRKIKANFINMGHPGKLSELSLINIKDFDKENIEVHEEQYYKVSEIYEFKDEINPADLVKRKGFSVFIRHVLRRLFYEVTGGQDIILLLPDFDKLYDKFIKNYTPPIRIRLMEAGANSLIEPAAAFTGSKVVQFFRGVEFLRALGFNVDSDLFKKLQERDSKIDPEVIQSLEKFEKQSQSLKNEFKAAGLSDSVIQSLINEKDFNKRTKILSKLGLDSGTERRFNYLLTSPSKDLKRQYSDILSEMDYDTRDITGERGKIAYYTGSFSDVASRAINPLGIIKDGLDTLADYTGISREDKDPTITENLGYLLGEYEELVAPNYNRVANQTEHHEQSEMDKISNSQKVTLSFSIVKKKNDNEINRDIVPTKANSINFYKFLAEFSTNVAKIEQDFPIRIKFFEENDLRRLEILQKYCKSYSYPTNEYERLIKTPMSYARPALVIADEFLVKNLFYPVTTTKINWSNVGYPIDEMDLEQFGVNSLYFRAIQRYREKLNAKFTGFANSMFQESFNSDILNILNEKNNEGNYKDRLPFASPVFICNSPRSNVLSYELEVDKLNSTVAYRAIIEYSKTAIITEALEPLRRSIYDKIFNIENLKNLVKEYLSQGLNYDEINERISLIASNKDLSRSTVFNNIGFDINRELIAQNKVATNQSGKDPSPPLLKYLLEDLMTDINRGKGNTKFSVTTDIKLNPILKRKQILNDLYRKLWKVRVKTLPFFDINNTERLYSGAFLIVRNILRPDEVLRENQQFNYLTGLYFITGFRHVITLNSAYSEFSLCKDIDLENEVQI